MMNQSAHYVPKTVETLLGSILLISLRIRNEKRTKKAKKQENKKKNKQISDWSQKFCCLLFFFFPCFVGWIFGLCWPLQVKFVVFLKNKKHLSCLFSKHTMKTPKKNKDNFGFEEKARFTWKNQETQARNQGTPKNNTFDFSQGFCLFFWRGFWLSLPSGA